MSNFVSLLQPISDENFRSGINRIYDWNLAKSLRKIYARHHPVFVNAANGDLKSEFIQYYYLNVCSLIICSGLHNADKILPQNMIPTGH